MASCLSSGGAVGKPPVNKAALGLAADLSASDRSAGKAHLAQFLFEAWRNVGAVKREGEVGGEEPQPRAAIVGSPVEPHPVKGLRAGELDHTVGELDFAPGALLDQLQDLEDLWLEDVAPGNDEIGRGRPRLRLLDHPSDLERRAMIGAEANNPVLMGLGGRNLFNRDDIAAVLL